MESPELIPFCRPHLIQGGLGHRVVLHTQPLLVAGKLAEDAGQSPDCVWQLILQGVVVLLLQDAAREGLLDEILHWLQGRGGSPNPHDHRVAVAESATNAHGRRARKWIKDCARLTAHNLRE